MVRAFFHLVLKAHGGPICMQHVSLSTIEPDSQVAGPFMNNKSDLVYSMLSLFMSQLVSNRHG